MYIINVYKHYNTYTSGVFYLRRPAAVQSEGGVLVVAGSVSVVRRW